MGQSARLNTTQPYARRHGGPGQAVLMDAGKFHQQPWTVMRDARDIRHGLWPLADCFTILLMFQFVSHSAQQKRQAKGLWEGLPCPEKFCDIQDILFPSCA